jgi:hypothetical protein
VPVHFVDDSREGVEFRAVAVDEGQDADGHD